ncbi:hypothetical protein EJ08DRAFT_650269 [Tothia fuscella]|uniref:Ribosomal protein bL31m N-terminal domain-containing protein n=1 Tax=Tothia fuscella TaxID=1048955 RepID=A0A9P4TY74_9PEZI|nr:hypothetical protein EJ08DRAFT_650269 [Tothia fuscella]
MSSTLQTLTRRTSLPNCQFLHPNAHHQIRHATLIKRPKRPYTFTQLVTLTDGSTYLHRTTSPLPVYKSTKDARNSPMWNPSSQKLLNIEEDEAGKLRNFRKKFGRGWDAEAVEYDQREGDAEAQTGEESSSRNDHDDSLLDLISGYGKAPEKKAAKKEPKKKSGPVANASAPKSATGGDQKK